MGLYSSENYRDYVKETLALGRDSPARGAIQSLAQHLGCHPSFVSQVLRGKSHFNHEQGVRFCGFAQLLEDEAEYFIDLLNRDRAGTMEARAHFDRILRRKRKERSNLQKRARLSTPLTIAREALYFQNWINPLVHAALSVPGNSSVKAIARTLGIPESQAAESLKQLKSIGLAITQNEVWKLGEGAVHIGRESKWNQLFHSNWRLKTASLLMEGRRTAEHTHFSSVFAVSRKDVERLREIVLSFLQDIRGRMVESDSERLFALCLDYFPIEYTTRGT